MSNVRLSIGGRMFAVACADGEEAHVSRLGELIDQKVAAAGAASQPEPRMLLFASLMLADEVHELRTATASGGSAAAAATAGEAPSFDISGLADRLDHITRRIENLSRLLEDGAASA